jgi:hypothetical protein
MPDWVQALKFSGDFRGRFEGLYTDATFVNAGLTKRFVSRNRFRYRIRFGVTATLFDHMEVGLRLSSSDTASGFSSSTGNPLSGNSTMQDNASKKFIFVDQAYGRWFPLNGPDWIGSLTVGKMENPFVFDDMI